MSLSEGLAITELSRNIPLSPASAFALSIAAETAETTETVEESNN